MSCPAYKETYEDEKFIKLTKKYNDGLKRLRLSGFRSAVYLTIQEWTIGFHRVSIPYDLEKLAEELQRSPQQTRRGVKELIQMNILII